MPSSAASRGRVGWSWWLGLECWRVKIISGQSGNLGEPGGTTSAMARDQNANNIKTKNNSQTTEWIQTLNTIGLNSNQDCTSHCMITNEKMQISENCIQNQNIIGGGGKGGKSSLFSDNKT